MRQTRERAGRVYVGARGDAPRPAPPNDEESWLEEDGVWEGGGRLRERGKIRRAASLAGPPGEEEGG